MKRIIIFLIAFLPLFGQVYAGEATLVITDYKVDNPEGAQGAVVVNNGSTTIKASRGATITKNFKVELGTEYTITNE